MTIQARYQDAGGGAVASYNWEDLATATGYSTLYGMDTDDDKYLLTPLQVHSNTGKTDDSQTTFDTEVNFDVSYALPRTIKGDLLITVTYHAKNAGVDSTNCALKIRPYHVTAGGTETGLAAQQTTDNISDSGSSGVTTRTTLLFAVDRHFKKDEKLRIEIILSGASPVGASSFGRFYHDGANRDFGDTLDVGSAITAPTDLIIQIPYKIDL